MPSGLLANFLPRQVNDCLIAPFWPFILPVSTPYLYDLGEKKFQPKQKYPNSVF